MAQMPKDFQDAMSKIGLLMAVSEISALNKNKTHALSGAQAKKVLSILNPLRSKPKLSCAEAQAVSGKLQKVITPSQERAYEEMMKVEMDKAMRKMKASGKTPGMYRQLPKGANAHMGPGGRKFGGPKPDAKQMARANEEMKSFNPLYSGLGKGSKSAIRVVHSMDTFFNDLKKRAGN